MTQPTLEQIISAWAEDREHIPQQRASAEKQIKYHIVQLLAQGRSAPVETLADLTGLPVETVAEVLSHLRAHGCEYDSDEDIVGCALTLNPTPYRFQVNDQHLYAWCALDTLFLPGQIGQAAQIASRCPVTGQSIRLTVTPEGVAEVAPSEVIISVVLPGITPGCTLDRTTGPGSASCTQMYFFASRETTQTWLNHHPKVAILTLEEAFELARVIWIEPYTRIAQSNN